MLAKKYSTYEVKKDTKKANLIDRIRYSIGMKRVNRAIRNARSKNKNECSLSYWVIESIEKELKEKGYEVVRGDIQAVYYCWKYTYIKW